MVDLVSGEVRINDGREYASWMGRTGKTRSRNALSILSIGTMTIGCAFSYYASQAGKVESIIVFST
ncbi:hypothetical protein [Anaplasma phagocytophilum]|uniref:hypothetical protein n=1 Tax=Anaplasma phagocytophilum TaxID=948 RepID=UPI00201AB97C